MSNQEQHKHGDDSKEVGDDERSVGIDTYKQFLSTIRSKIGGTLPPMAADTSVGVTFCSHTGYSPKTKKDALKVASEQKDHIVTWVDDEGRKWIGLKLSAYDLLPGSFPYTPDDVDALKQIIETEVSQDRSDKTIIGWANRQISEIEAQMPVDEDDREPTTEHADEQATEDGVENTAEGQEA